MVVHYGRKNTFDAVVRTWEFLWRRLSCQWLSSLIKRIKTFWQVEATPKNISSAVSTASMLDIRTNWFWIKVDYPGGSHILHFSAARSEKVKYICPQKQSYSVTVQQKSLRSRLNIFNWKPWSLSRGPIRGGWDKKLTHPHLVFVPCRVGGDSQWGTSLPHIPRSPIHPPSLYPACSSAPPCLHSQQLKVLESPVLVIEGRSINFVVIQKKVPSNFHVLRVWRSTIGGSPFSWMVRSWVPQPVAFAELNFSDCCLNQFKLYFVPHIWLRKDKQMLNTLYSK